MTVLVIGSGAVGTIAAYTLQQKTDVTVIVRSGYDKVKEEGFVIKSVDYGNVSYKPTNIVKDLQEASKYGPFDHIIVCTKVIPKESNNIWDQVKQVPQLRKPNTNIVLIQNGVGIEKYWHDIDDINLISGVSYISSTKVDTTINHLAPDEVAFGYFNNEKSPEKLKSLETFVNLYKNDKNQPNVRVDDNVRFTRMKKLLYNASYNTICCLINVDVGIIYQGSELMVQIEKLMKEIQLVANTDLTKKGSDKLIEDDDIKNMIKFTEEVDVPINYQPSMLVDFRNGREIEVEVILGNLIEIYYQNGGQGEIPLLEFIYGGLKVVQYRLVNKL